MSDSFCVAFSILGGALLFLSSKPTTVGSVVLVAAVSAAISNAFGDSTATRRIIIDVCGNSNVPIDTSAVSIAQLCAYRAMQLMPWSAYTDQRDTL